ncbi:type IV secretory system conjugative DNA transfer family protein [Streptomyces canus]|uniref:type IV secretory system conjugative DNA transfer family protein n=1 Tax=Streptomyces canus TaxID=58343 RepID=UPI0030E46620
MDDEFELLATVQNGGLGHRVAMGLDGGAIYRGEERQPLIVFGPQRSGKTTGVVIPAILEWSGPCLVTSVRFDVVAATLERRSGLGDVYIFDPAGLAESIGRRFAPHCVGWSPLDSIQEWDDAVRQAESLTSGTDFGGVKAGDFWASQTRLLLTPLLYAAARTGATMGHVLEWLNESRGDLVASLLKRRQKLDPSPEAGGWQRCITRLVNYSEYHEQTYSSICATAATTLEVFALEGVNRRCAETRRLPLNKFLDGGPHTLFLCAPPHQQRQFMPLFTALARQAVSEVIDRNGAPDETGQAKIQVPLMLCLDEAGNIARLDDLDTFATTAAGSGIQLISVFHDMSQLYATYGEDRGALIVNNHRGKLFLPGNSDTRTGSFLHELLQSSDVRGQNRLGWKLSDLREMQAEKVLCLYGGLPAKVLKLRRWHESADLLDAVERARRAYRANPPEPHRLLRPPAPPELESAATLEELQSLGSLVLWAVERLDLGALLLPCWFAHRPVIDILHDLIENSETTQMNAEDIRAAAEKAQPLMRQCRAAHVPAAPSLPRRSDTEAHRRPLDLAIRKLQASQADESDER